MNPYEAPQSSLHPQADDERKARSVSVPYLVGRISQVLFGFAVVGFEMYLGFGLTFRLLAMIDPEMLPKFNDWYLPLMLGLFLANGWLIWRIRSWN